MRIAFNNLFKNFNKNKLILNKFDRLIKNNQFIGGKIVKDFENKLEFYFKLYNSLANE